MAGISNVMSFLVAITCCVWMLQCSDASRTPKYDRKKSKAIPKYDFSPDKNHGSISKDSLSLAPDGPIMDGFTPKDYYARKHAAKHAMAISPRCSKRETWLDIQLYLPDGKGCKGALIYFVDDHRLAKQITGKNGKVKVRVSGCKISMIITGKGIQPQYKTHTLFDCKDEVEKIVVHVYPRCNFPVYFFNYEDESNLEVIDYIVVARDANFGKSIVSSGRGVGGGSPICIPSYDTGYGSEDGLRMLGRSQSSAEPFLLEIDFYYSGAAVALPTHIEDDYILLVCFNMWERGKPHEGLIDLAGAKVIGSETLSGSDNVRMKGNCIEILEIDEEVNDLLCFGFIESYRSLFTSIQIDGNVSVRDKNGHITSIRFPGANYPGLLNVELNFNIKQGLASVAFLPVLRLFCICPGKKKLVVPVNDKDYTFIFFLDENQERIDEGPSRVLCSFLCDGEVVENTLSVLEGILEPAAAAFTEALENFNP